ncbi:hypothetical protein GCM10028806_50160 [Spirosoma terrae]|uniref:Uncharacterized protein n=1 Tax=Spirosoma terrae TaxID=1968276 RepID=A0A6L9L1E6_9BACT|nr:hypothetical protein [Spirosoma terrae]NDU93322.1 hypothetical protein [Spirosoma terrae]
MTQYVDDLKDQIERILRWEPSAHWRPRDFVQLSELIFDHTQQRIEAHHLQIFWRTSEIISPNLLNELARFADYTDWRDFCLRNSYGSVSVDNETVLTHSPMWEIPIRWVVAICWFSVIASVVIAILLVWKR